MFIEKFNLPWKPFQIARRVTVQMVINLPKEERGGFQIGTNKTDISNETIIDFYENKASYENYNESKIYKKSGGYYYNKTPHYILPRNDGTTTNLNIHISEDQIKRYFSGGTQVPIPILYSFCKVIGSSLDIFMECANSHNQYNWNDITLNMLMNKETNATFHTSSTSVNNFVNLSSYGITAILSPDEMEERFNIELNKAESAYFIYHILYEFICKRVNLFVQKINEGCHYKFLLGCDENSEFMQEISLINNGKANIRTARIAPTLETFKMIKHKLVNPDATGSEAYCQGVL